MVTSVLWWMAQCAGLGAIVYILLWGIGKSGVGDPFQKIMTLAVYVGGVAFGIIMVLRLFEILGHPLF